MGLAAECLFSAAPCVTPPGLGVLSYDQREGGIATCCIVLQLYIVQLLIPFLAFLVAMTTMSCTDSTLPLSTPPP